MQDDPFAIFEAPKRSLDPREYNAAEDLRKKVHLNESNSSQHHKRSSQGSNKSNNNTPIEQEQRAVSNPMAALEQQLEVVRDEDSDNEQLLQKIKPENIQILMERQEQGCIHEVFYPKDYIRKQYHGPYDAKQYKFRLDPFQQKSVHAIQCDESVLVCAHTSAGKTAIAEYAIAHSLKNRSRVIYTSPIKALSNQKYRQLKEEFLDVGLITGDVTIDQNATCLVMTTEILRNMIYRGSEIVREVKWVIFDQVHYMRDKERGVVWQETIIMLPSNVKYVFLSATIGNPSQFATWITKLRKQPCNVVYTDYRPVPLEHYLCPAGGQGLYMVVDDKGKFYENNFNKAMNQMGESINVIGMDDKKNKKKMSQGSDLQKIIKIIMQQNLDPVIVFSFSKKQVETYAKSICSKYDLTTKDQKQRIQQVFNNAVDILSEEDKNLPQLKSLKQIIKKGIGIHHGGLLPLLKEVVELLFQDGLLKVLFSTETFSMGLNMPARTVVFTSVKKWDGQKSRWITGGQYIQMSGRAGRRGLDKKGMTILMLDEKMQPNIAKDMLKGKSDDLLSSFYINYNMLLNSQRLEDIDSDYILSRSLLQFQHEAKLPALIADHKQKLEAWKALKFDEQESLEQLYLLKERAAQHKSKVKQLSKVSKNVLPYTNIGRIVHMKEGQNDWGLGVIINFHKKEMRKGKQAGEPVYLFDVMVYCKPRDPNKDPSPKPAKFDEQGQLCVITFSMSCIEEITIWKISKLPPQITTPSSKKQILKVLIAFGAKKPQYISIVSNTPECMNEKRLLDMVEEQIMGLKHLEPQLQAYKKKRDLYDEVKKSAAVLKNISGIVLRKEKKAYNRVMKRTALVEKGVVTLKGNVACEISSNNHEILLTHLLFSGYFSDMTPIQIASVLTSLVHEQKSSTERKVTKNPRLRFKLQELLQHAKSIFSILKECKVSIEEDEYMESIKEQLVEVCYEWCNGATFAQLCKMTDTYEGSIIRTLRRLNQLLKQMANASTIIGNEQLASKFTQASQKVFRGIVQAASLYTL